MSSCYQISFYVTSQYGWQITILVDVVVSQFHLTTKMKNTTLHCIMLLLLSFMLSIGNKEANNKIYLNDVMCMLCFPLS